MICPMPCGRTVPAPALTRVVLLLLAALSLLPWGAAAAQGEGRWTPQTVPLDGAWEFMPATLGSADKYLPDAGGDWTRIRVPANWYLEGQDFSGAAWYRREFEAGPELAGKVVRLVFEGVDYAADVWLNGAYVGFHEGSFQPFSLDVSGPLWPGARNVLVVRVDSPFEEPGRVWSLRKRLIKGIFSHHDARPGGAWSLRGQEKNTGGIWGSVHLAVSDQVAIEQVRVTPVLGDGPARAEVTLEMLNPGAAERSLDVALELVPANFVSGTKRSAAERVTVRPGRSQVRLRIEEPAPRLWWPAEHGEPDLYRVEVRVAANGELLDGAGQEFGFRTISYDGGTGTWSVNGKRIFLRGTNYISSQWLSEMTEEKYARDLELMAAANINAVRVHAHVEAERFYSLCDRMGILVWQDFPLQWGYDDSAAFVAEASRQVRDMITMLYDHPSIIAWSLHNEPPWDADWMKYKYPDYDPGQNRELDRALQAVAVEEDATRHVQSHSATAEHPWLGWYSGDWRDYGKPTKQPLITEFGAQALPDLDSLTKIFTAEELWPDNDAEWSKWEYHNFQRRETFELARISMGSSIQEFINNTQAYQAKLIKYAAESYRRQRYAPVGAIFQFMFVENWPSINWGIVDYWRASKAGYDALRIAYQTVLPSIEWNKDAFTAGEPVSVKVWVINDLHRRFAGALLEQVLRRNGAIVSSERRDLAIEADNGRRIAELTWHDLLVGSYEFEVTLRDGNGAELGRNLFAFSVGPP